VLGRESRLMRRKLMNPVESGANPAAMQVKKRVASITGLRP